MSKICCSRRNGSWLVCLLLAGAALPLRAQAGVAVSGRVTLLEREEQRSSDVGQAVLWLTGDHARAGTPTTTEMATEGKQFVPHLAVVPLGSSIAFPNHDPFNHNVFSLSQEASFDLGFFGRGDARSVRFEKAGVIRVYCNVHAQMRGIVLVLETALYAQPSADGSFRIEGVPPGEYVLHAWHERAPAVSLPLRVPQSGAAPLLVTLDARGYRLVQHRDKEGKSYSDRSRRY
jgi:plastocyanin